MGGACVDGQGTGRGSPGPIQEHDLTRGGGGGRDFSIFLWVAEPQAGVGAPCRIGVGVGVGNDRISR